MLPHVTPQPVPAPLQIYEVSLKKTLTKGEKKNPGTKAATSIIIFTHAAANAARLRTAEDLQRVRRANPVPQAGTHAAPAAAAGGTEPQGKAPKPQLLPGALLSYSDLSGDSGALLNGTG